MLKFADMMHRGLTDAGYDTKIIRPPAVIGRIYSSARGVGKWLGYADKFAVFPPLLSVAAKWADIVHVCDHSNAPYLKYIWQRPHVVTCHDMIGARTAFGNTPGPRSRWTGRYLQRTILKGLREAQHIACVSEATRKEVLSIANVPDDRVSVIYNGLNYPYSPMPEQEASSRIRALCGANSSPFVLHVGGNQWYKNRLGVMRIFSRMRSKNCQCGLKLIMVGSAWTAEMRQFVSGNSLSNCVYELTGVADGDLKALYSRAELLLFPSLDEGFGWPIIEAQACGCPVVTTNRAPMDEIGGKAAIYIEPENVESAAARILEVLDNLQHLRAAGLRNASRFSVSAMIHSYSNLYRRVLEEKCGPTQLNGLDSPKTDEAPVHTVA